MTSWKAPKGHPQFGDWGSSAGSAFSSQPPPLPWLWHHTVPATMINTKLLPRISVRMLMENGESTANLVNGHFRKPNWRYLPYIKPKNFRAIFQGISQQHMALYGSCSSISGSHFALGKSWDFSYDQWMILRGHPLTSLKPLR